MSAMKPGFILESFLRLSDRTDQEQTRQGGDEQAARNPNHSGGAEKPDGIGGHDPGNMRSWIRMKWEISIRESPTDGQASFSLLSCLQA